VGTLNASAFANHAMARQVDQRRQRLNTVRSMKCAGAEYVRLCRGETRFSLFTKLMPWDHAPGTLIFAEAGGHSRLLDGRPYRPTVRAGRGLLHASDPDTWQRIYDTLFADA
jgi:fructose-1,6-bisphosphatase/inositol monophosphatase family enzyme